MLARGKFLCELVTHGRVARLRCFFFLSLRSCVSVLRIGSLLYPPASVRGGRHFVRSTNRDILERNAGG